MNIVLTGYRCCGKSSVGRRVAEKTGREFADIDDLVEKKAGSSIQEIILKSGWDLFRAMERETIQEISERDNLVIATGGGAVTNEENVFNLRKNGFIVRLKADAGIIRERMGQDRKNGNIRPSLTGSGVEDEIMSVLKEREPCYRESADMTVDTGLLSVEEAAEAIIKGVRA